MTFSRVKAWFPRPSRNDRLWLPDVAVGGPYRVHTPTLMGTSTKNDPTQEWCYELTTEYMVVNASVLGTIGRVLGIDRQEHVVTLALANAQLHRLALQLLEHDARIRLREYTTVVQVAWV